MKKFILHFSVGLLALFLSINYGFSQPSDGGTPPSFTYKSVISNTFDERNIQGIDVNQALHDDSLKGGPEWAGRSVPVGLSMLNAGTWTDLPDGRKVWRLKLTSTGAKAIVVCYDDFYIPEGGKLFLYNELQTQVIGAYTSKNNPASRIFSTEMIQGESVTLEYVAPVNLPKKYDPFQQINGMINGNHISNSSNLFQGNNIPVIRISEIAYVYRDVPFLKQYDQTKTTGWGASLACEVNINCSEGSTWQSQKKGVAEIWLKNGTSWGWCSGGLVNTTNNSGTPYFLTADHCHGEPAGGTPFASAADMLQWQFYFKYEGTTCPDPGTEPVYSTITGCSLTSSSPINGGSDFCLVLLGTTPPQSYNPYYNGWDRTNGTFTGGVGISHPMGDIKKISTFTATLGTGTWSDGTNTGTTNAHWTGTWVATTNGYGQVEGGSSGSSLFNSAQRVVGTLTGGTAASCTTGSSFLYGKFYYHWDLDGAASTVRLKPWLDPLGTNPTTVNGFDPYSGYPDFYGTPTTLYEGQTANFTDLTVGATSWTWEFEGGTPATSTTQNPTNIYYYQQGTYKVKLTTNTPIAGTQSQEKIAYIKVLPGTALTQIWCDDFSTPANWTLSTSGGYTDAWVITTAAPTGTYSSAMGRISSTSGGNYALFDSDALGMAGDNQWANITNATGQNCSNYEEVKLQFQENYQKYYDSTLLYVSTDNFVTSTKYVLNSSFANNDASANPLIQVIDISSAAAGKTNVKVRFTYRSTQDMSTLAGWGYAWEIDDVCLLGVTWGNSLPNADFTATTSRKISPGQSVSFADLSTLATSWSWTFTGGTPATSSVQNPTNIVYNTEGYYPVTLTAINQNGSVAATKTDYIHVFYNCDYDSNVQDGDAATYYKVSTPSWGYTPGHNNTGITAYADKYTIGTLTGKVKSMIVAVGSADVVGGATNVTFTVWDNNAGVPGTVLMTKVVPVSQLQAGYLNTVDFAPVSVGSTFFVGFSLTNVASLDTFACYLANGGAGRTNTAYCYNGSTWVTYQSQFGVNGSLYILPEFCLDKPVTNILDVDFFASQTEIIPGASISFTDQSTGGPAATTWSWTLTGGTPATSTVQNPPTVTYNTAGLYDVTHTATNTNGTGTKTKGGYILVSPISNLVYWNFPSGSANATADGGITANLTMTIGKSTGVGTLAYTTTGSGGGTDKCTSSNGWNDALTTSDYVYVSFTTLGYINIKMSSKQSGTTTAAPKNFAVYYSPDGGSNFYYLTDVPAMSTAGNWTQGVLNNIQLPSSCDNQASVMLLWLKTTNTSMAGGTVTAAAVSQIDDIYVTGQACSTLPATPGTITGLATVCQGQTGVVYTVPAITGATIYNWTIPTGATIVSGQNTNTITVDFAINQAAGNINVYGENICGIGPTSANKAVAVNLVPANPGTITGIQTVAGGQTGVAYSVGAVTGATSYTWTMPSFATIATGGTTNSITVNYACPGDFGNMTVHANNGCGAGPESYAKTITIHCAPVADFYASSVQICPAGIVTFTDISTNSPTAWSWTFAGGTPGTSTAEHPTVTYSTAGTYAVTLQVTNAYGNNTITKNSYITVGGPAASVSIAAVPSGAICAGTSVTFTATPTNGGTTPAYQWKLNGANVGTNSPTYTNAALTNGNIITCVMTSNLTCPTGNPATSNAITMTVNPNVVASVIIAAVPAGAICAGTNVTFTATPTNGGATPVYQWKLNGANIGTNSTTYTNAALANGDLVTCVMTSNASCISGSPSTSNVITMTVNPNVIASVSIAAVPAGAICAGTSVTFTATPTNGGATPAYQWKLNGANVGTNITTYTNAALANGDLVTCVMTSNAACATGSPATSNVITMTVNPSLPVSLSIAAVPAGAICAGTSVTFTATPTNGGTTPAYQWKLNGANVGTNSPTYTNAALTNGNQVTCVLTSNATCATGSPATSNVITMTVNATLVPSVSIVASSNPICTGASVTFTATPTNGGATPAYQWKLNGANVGANSPTYTNAALANGDLVSCVLTSNLACASPTTATSNIITMTVNATLVPSVSIVASLNPICTGTSVTFTATPTNGGATPSYQWKLNGANVGTNSSTYTNAALANGNQVSCVLTSSFACASPTTANSNVITMTVSGTVTPLVSISASANPICSGTNVTFTATPTNGGTTPSYQWYLNGTPDGTNSAIYSNAALVNGDLVSCVMTSNLACASPTTATSNTITLIVTGTVTPVVNITASSNPICSGTNVTFTATPTNGGTTPSYQWYLNGTMVGSNSSTYSNATLANNDQVSCVMTSNASCVSPASVLSNIVIMTVSGTLIPAVSIIASNNPICAGTSVIFTATPTNGGAPAYQWKLNGANVGTNSSTYTNAALANGDQVSCVMTSSLTCASPTLANSNIITMTVNTSVTPGISIIASSNPICLGSNVIFTATPVYGGTTPSYQWYVNGFPVGIDSDTYSNSSLADGDIVSCTLTSSEFCVTSNPVTSNSITIIVSTGLPVSISITTSNNPICAGNIALFTATSTNGGTTPVYQWMVNGNPVGGNSSSFSSSSLADGDVVYCQLTSSESCATGNPASSNTVLMIIYPLPTTPVIYQSGDTLYSSSPSGNQWYFETLNVLIPGATNQYYVPPVSGNFYVIITDSNGCVSDTSNLFNFIYIGISSNASGLNFFVYPNPNNGLFTIQIDNMSNENIQLDILNVLGESLLRRNITNPKTDIDMSNFSAGVYFAEIKSIHGSSVLKILIHK